MSNQYYYSEVDENIEGAKAFVTDMQRYVNRADPSSQGTTDFIWEISERYAYLCKSDLRKPLRFLKQAAGAPPVEFGTKDFNPELVDDANPARHYTAFVFLGYFFPYPLAVIGLWLWEVAGFVRYKGHWSQRDIDCGYVGIRHGREVRRHGAEVLPGLVVDDLVVG